MREEDRARWECVEKYGVSYGSPMVKHRDSSGRLYYTPYGRSSISSSGTSSRHNESPHKSPPSSSSSEGRGGSSSSSSKKSNNFPIYKEVDVYVTEHGVYDAKTGKLLLKPDEGKVFDVEAIQKQRGGKIYQSYKTEDNKHVWLDKGVKTKLTEITGYRSIQKVSPQKSSGQRVVALEGTPYDVLIRKSSYDSAYKSEAPITGIVKYKVTDYGVVYTSDLNKYTNVRVKKPTEEEIRESYKEYLKQTNQMENAKPYDYKTYKQMYMIEWQKAATSPSMAQKAAQQLLKTQASHEQFAEYRQKQYVEEELKKRAKEIYEQNRLARFVATSPFTTDYKTYGAFITSGWRRRKDIFQAITDTEKRRELVEGALKLRKQEGIRNIYESAREPWYVRSMKSPYIVAGISYDTAVLGGAGLTAATELAPPAIGKTITAGSIVAGTIGASEMQREWQEANKIENPSERVGRKFQIASSAVASAIGFTAGAKAMSSFLSETVKPSFVEVRRKPVKLNIEEGRLNVRPETAYDFSGGHGVVRHQAGELSVLSRLRGKMSLNEKAIYHPEITRGDIYRGKIYNFLKEMKLNKINWKSNPMPQPEVIRKVKIENVPVDVKSAYNIRPKGSDEFYITEGRQTIKLRDIGKTFKTNMPEEIITVKNKLSLKRNLPEGILEKRGMRIYRSRPSSTINEHSTAGYHVETFLEREYPETIKTSKSAYDAIKVSRERGYTRDIYGKTRSITGGRKIVSITHPMKEGETLFVEAPKYNNIVARKFSDWSDYVESEPISYWLGRFETEPKISTTNGIRMTRGRSLGEFEAPSSSVTSSSAGKQKLLLKNSLEPTTQKTTYSYPHTTMRNVRVIEEPVRPPAALYEKVKMKPVPISKQIGTEILNRMTPSELPSRAEVITAKPSLKAAQREELMSLQKPKIISSLSQRGKVISALKQSGKTVSTHTVQEMKTVSKEMQKTSNRQIPIVATKIKSMVKPVQSQIQVTRTLLKISPRLKPTLLTIPNIAITPTIKPPSPPQITITRKIGGFKKSSGKLLKLKRPKIESTKRIRKKFFKKRGLLPDELSILKSYLKYGKATPLSIEKSWKAGAKTLYQIIPTAEELKLEGKKKKKKKVRKNVVFKMPKIRL